MNLPTIIERRRLSSPAMTPQALACDGEQLWMSSRDLGQLYRIDVAAWKIVEKIEPPGVVWAAVPTNDGMRFTVGEGADDDRYVYRYSPDNGFARLFACPEFTGSYLSFDGEHLYLSQWYKRRILKFDADGNVLEEIDVGAEICGHVFANGMFYVLRGVEHPDEDWRIARFHLGQGTPEIEDMATVPFACRSLTFDGENFWSNHRAANETVSFALP